ncbi:hypothetical protein IV203_022898 [Nitzschia inconspicua]|uniref:Uncharacterized protein n=1 Tax=Nitzschia inconspicua TaxID=303405 RepID=A0A9K3PB03_9STRA|nr:hypothetical protein IV203_022898 [Nitzschia inconspicua]
MVHPIQMFYGFWPSYLAKTFFFSRKLRRSSSTKYQKTVSDMTGRTQTNEKSTFSNLLNGKELSSTANEFVLRKYCCRNVT